MKLRTTLLAVTFGVLSALSSVPAYSQGCAMCYATAAGSSKDGQRAISKGVLVLLIPPVSFLTLGVALAFRYSRKRDLEQNH